MNWFTADWHFFHKNVLRYEPDSRPFRNVDKMNNVIIQKINEKVAPNDYLYVLGDVSLISSSNADKLRKLIKKIQCEHLVLILGNHDTLKPFTYVDLGFESVHTSLEVNDFVLIHDPAIGETISRDRKILCGHVHSLFKRVRNIINVGVDVWNLEPVLEDTLKAEFERTNI